MFILRRITGEGCECNTCLGESYHYVNSEVNKVEYERVFSNYFHGIEKPPFEVYGFLIYDDGGETIPLHRPSRYYIMTDSGKTFANLTFR